ncbi:MAG TPA: DUF1592 domain-containing protein [Bryobacteraceae bacterium]|nr:DUF1592 domain-containing protein [Bryobacteraceae bacterium]
MAQSWPVQAADGAPASLEPVFSQAVKPFLKQNCQTCHNADNMTAGVRVDQLDAGLEDRHLKLWESIRHRVGNGTMPPKGLPQPSNEDRQKIVDWISRALEIARSRPTPMNGSARRLTVAQYRNTLRDLLHLEDDLTEILPPDAISKDGFVNNKETLQLSPLLLEAYLEIAEEALSRAIVDPAEKPAIQNFRMDLGAGINKNPIPDELVLGALSHLLENKDFTVTQLTAQKPFPFTPFFMRTKYRFIEGYQGNDTVRGWRDFDSIYHAVFACVRGSRGYPKGDPYNAVPEGLLLRPAIPNDELFEGDGTYGPKANFKISLRELPDAGRFRVTVTAAKYNDGLLLDAGIAPQAESVAGALVVQQPKASFPVHVAKPGIYQVDVYATPRGAKPVPPDSSRLNEGLAGAWAMNGNPEPAGQLQGQAKFADSPFGQALSLNTDADFVTVPRSEAMNVGEGDFTVAAWIHTRALRKSGIVSLGAEPWTHGWFFDLSDGRGSLRLETTGPDTKSNGSVIAPAGTIRPNAWQHVAAIVKRGKNQTMLYVNGFPVAKGTVGPANLDNLNLSLLLGRTGKGVPFRGELDDVRIYRRAIAEAELQALVQPGRQFAVAPPEKPQQLQLTLGGREFSGTLPQPAFLAVRLDAGVLPVTLDYRGVRGIDKVTLTPVTPASTVAQRFQIFEKRMPKLGVHLGLRRDCGSTFAQVGTAQVVKGTKLDRYVFEGAIRNFPSPDVEKDNVNYLAGVREIAVRSEYTDTRDMPRLLVRSVEFEGPFYESWPPPAHKNIFVDSPNKNNPQAYAREILRNFAVRAYRRPVTAQEEATLFAVFQKSTAAGANFRTGIRDALEVVLTSPQFLFLVENSKTSAAEPLTDYELASKLSYFLWNAPPDRNTLRLAGAGSLRGNLDAEVTRMTADPRFTQFLKEFTAQWLSLDKFQVLEPDRKKFPKLTRDTRSQLKQEPVQFLRYLIANNLPVRNLIASDVIVANETVASYYDLGDKTESGLDFVAIPHARRELGGVLTQAALMAGLSDGRESNPVKRGAWLARKIVAEPPDDPPPNVPALKEETKNLTLRQRLEQHRNQPGCQQCHMKIDPWGVALEQFDAGGRWKSEPADARSTLPDHTEVNGIEELKRYLGQDRVDQVAFSVLKHMTTYATGRSLTYYELNYLKQDAKKLRANGYRMKDMIRYVVNSKPFLEK